MITSNEITVFILAGGLGSRLGEITATTPKPMLPIRNRPFLDYLLNHLKKFGFQKVCLLLGEKADNIINHYNSYSIDGIKLSYSTEPTPLGTGGAIQRAMSLHASDHYLCLNGDSFFPINLASFIKQSSSKELCSLALFKSSQEKRYGSVILNDDNQIVSFNEKAQHHSQSLCNGGIYLLNRKIMSYMNEDKHSLEHDVFPLLAKDNKLWGFFHDNDFIDIGTPADYQSAHSLSLFEEDLSL